MPSVGEALRKYRGDAIGEAEKQYPVILSAAKNLLSSSEPKQILRCAQNDNC